MHQIDELFIFPLGDGGWSASSPTLPLPPVVKGDSSRNVLAQVLRHLMERNDGGHIARFTILQTPPN